MNLLLGLFLWDFFAEGTKVGLTSLQAKGFLLGKTQFPRWVLVVASLSNALVTVLIVSVVLVVALVAVGPSSASRSPPACSSSATAT